MKQKAWSTRLGECLESSKENKHRSAIKYTLQQHAIKNNNNHYRHHTSDDTTLDLAMLHSQNLLDTHTYTHSKVNLDGYGKFTLSCQNRFD